LFLRNLPILFCINRFGFWHDFSLTTSKSLL
jgi:hypothetical protein